eukprot:1506239-Prorocentrum_lima.AAC.1
MSALCQHQHPSPWPDENVKEPWSMQEEPGGEGRMWISSRGRIMWHAPDESEAITCEERTLPD